MGLSAAALDDAIKFAVASENPNPRDQVLTHAQTFGATEPFNTIIGPMKERGALNGLIIRRGYVVAEWGDTRRVDMTHSVTKTFLSTVVGLAWQKGLIRDVHDKVRDYMPSDVPLFEVPHNQAITWDHLLRQTSDWQGTVEQAGLGRSSRGNRTNGPAGSCSNRGPGQYNDVRVNVLALAALHVIRRPLPQLLREEVMDPIGASSTWRWHGYENSWIELDGRKVQIHDRRWTLGGGMFIDAWDLARLGYLYCATAGGGSARSSPRNGYRWRGLRAAQTRGTVT